MTVSFDTGDYHTLVLRIIAVRNNLADARAHSFHFKQKCQSMQRQQSYQPDEERMHTDGQTAFQLFIVDITSSCMYNQGLIVSKKPYKVCI